MEPGEVGRNSAVGGLLVLAVRGVLLWLVVPVALALWPLVRARRRRATVSIGQYLGWVDLNLVACLQRLATRLVVRHPVGWTPWRDLPAVTHRLRSTDPA